MNFQQFKIDFLSFLQEKYNIDTNLVNSDSFSSDNINIFMYQSEFEEYLKTNSDLDISLFSSDGSDLSSINLENSNYTQKEITDEENEIIVDLLKDYTDQEEILNSSDAENALTPNVKNSSLNFSDNYNDVFDANELSILNTLFDLNKDGSISDDENTNALDMINLLDGNADSLTKKDFEIIKNYISKLLKSGMDNKEIINNIMSLDSNSESLSIDDFQKIVSNNTSENLTETIPLTNQSNSQNEIQNNSSSNSTSDNISSSNRNNTPSGSAQTEKNVNNMSIKELEAELENAKSAVSTAENDYKNELKLVNEELSKKMTETTENISLKESELESANTQLSDLNSKINADTSALNDANARIGDIDSSISELESLLTNEDVDKESIQSQISNLEEEKRKIEEETIPGLEESIETNQNAVQKLESETIPAIQSELAKLNEDYAKYEQEVKNISESNNGLKIKLETYESALEYKNNVEKTLQSKKISQEKALNSDMPKNSEAPQDYSSLDEYTFKNLPLSYSLNGQEYHCVGIAGYDLNSDGKVDFKPDSWEELQRYFANGGVANIGKYGTKQCHNYSDMLGQFVLGDVNQEFVQALYDETNNPEYGNKDTAGKMGTDKNWNPRRFAACKSNNRDEERAIIENELQNGRPCLIRVDGYSHYVAAVGIADNGDILIWDSYDGDMERLGRTANNDNNEEHRNLVNKDGVMVYCEGYSYQYATAKTIDYWSYVGNSPEYVLKNGYKT